MFEVVFDYGGEHYIEDEHANQPINVFIDDEDVNNSNVRQWEIRQDPFSTYRAGFEIRTYRLCKRILIFHHFPDELQIPDYLVKSTDFIYGESPAASFITQIIQSSYFFKDNKYLKKSFPPLEFKYSDPSSKKNGALEDFSTLEFEFNPSSISDIIRE